MEKSRATVPMRAVVGFRMCPVFLVVLGTFSREVTEDRCRLLFVYSRLKLQL